MPVLAASPSPRNHRSYFIALGFIIALAAAEILAALIHFRGKARSERAASPAATLARLASRNAAPSASSRASAPAPSAVPPSSATVSASERLLTEARALNERGDTANALARLQEASQRDPKNPQVLAEMATIYESIQLFDRSNETWRKIQELDR